MIIFLLEERSMAEFLKHFLPLRFAGLQEKQHFFCLPHEGKQDLYRSIPTKIKGFRQTYSNARFVVVHDQDSHDCLTLKQQLLQRCRDALCTDVIVRIVCRELESWMLGDLRSLTPILTLRNPARTQKKEKFRQPDQLNNPKQELEKLLGHSMNLEVSKKAGFLMAQSQNQNCSHSFKVFLKSLTALVPAADDAQN